MVFFTHVGSLEWIEQTSGLHVILRQRGCCGGSWTVPGMFLVCSNVSVCVFQGGVVIDSVTGATKEEGSGSFPPPGDDTPSQAATLEPDKPDRGERPPSSE